jgi:hypothetical protein
MAESDNRHEIKEERKKERKVISPQATCSSLLEPKSARKQERLLLSFHKHCMHILFFDILSAISDD